MGKYDDRPYEVGKGKPPKQHRWQPGQSGNPRGPRRRSDPREKDHAELLADIINKKSQLRVGDGLVNMSMKEYILRGLVHSAATGPAVQRTTAIKMLIVLGAFDEAVAADEPKQGLSEERVAAFVAQLAAEGAQEEAREAEAERLMSEASESKYS